MRALTRTFAITSYQRGRRFRGVMPARLYGTQLSTRDGL